MDHDTDLQVEPRHSERQAKLCSDWTTRQLEMTRRSRLHSDLQVAALHVPAESADQTGPTGQLGERQQGSKVTQGKHSEPLCSHRYSHVDSSAAESSPQQNYDFLLFWETSEPFPTGINKSVSSL